MLLRDLSETAQFVRVKLWNVFLGDFQTDTINAVLQNRKQNGQHTNTGWRQNKPIISYRVRPINLRLCDPLRGDSWYLEHINVAKKRKAKIQKQRDKGNLFLRNFFRKFHFCFQGQAMNIGEWSLPSQPCPIPQQGPKSFSLTVPPPACWFPQGYRLFMAEKAGLFKAGQGSQKHIRRSTMTSEGQSTPIPNSPFIYPSI